MEMLDILKKLASVDGSNAPAKPVVEKPAVLTEGKQVEINLPEPDISDLRALSGVKKQLNESTIAECGMMGMGAPMPSIPQMPATINMSAGNAQEIVSMMRGIMDLAKTDAASHSMGTPPMDPMLKALGDVDMDGDHDMKDHELEKPDSGSMSADSNPASMDDSGADELADIVKKIKTGEPVKISTDMPVKVSSDEPIKGSTTDKLNARSDDNNEEYDNSPNTSTRDYNPNDFAHVVNKVRDFDYTPPNSGSNPMPDPNKKKEESVDPLQAFEAKLFDEYKKFVSEGEKTMSRAAKGHEKYGKKGMQALAKAGKEGKDLDPIRDKYNKYD